MRIALFATLLFALLYGLNLALLMSLHRPWWRLEWVRRTARWLPVVAFSCGVVWALGLHFDVNGVTSVGAGGVASVHVMSVSLLIALVIISPVRGIELIVDASRRAARRRGSRGAPPLATAQSPDTERSGSGGATANRRRFLRTALVGVPLLTSGTAAYGLIRSATPARLTPVDLWFPDLAAPLDGFRILHLSDLHVGPYVELDDLEHLAQRASALKPDLVLVTGDICDHMPRYLDTLRLIEQIQPPAGVFASLGNHEHFRGLDQVLRAFERSQIQLLVDDGLTVQVGAATSDTRARAGAGSTPLFISGCDDPQWMRSPESRRRLARFVDESQTKAPVEGFRLLLSHRSTAFDFAAPLGVDLTLSGHTHGFQLGVGGRSLFEDWYPDRYIWGHYNKGNQQLYTSAGVGHWFPFRLGCPPEAPLITLRAGGVRA